MRNKSFQSYKHEREILTKKKQYKSITRLNSVTGEVTGEFIMLRRVEVELQQNIFNRITKVKRRKQNKAKKYLDWLLALVENFTAYSVTENKPSLKLTFCISVDD